MMEEKNMLIAILNDLKEETIRDFANPAGLDTFADQVIVQRIQNVAESIRAKSLDPNTHNCKLENDIERLRSLIQSEASVRER